MNESSKEYAKKISEDEILEKIVATFESKIGKPFSEERLNQIYQDGDRRYTENVPPGFKDKQKGGTRQFGDLVLWFQIIEISKEFQKDIIFITDDEKEDWLYIHKGRQIHGISQWFL